MSFLSYLVNWQILSLKWTEEESERLISICATNKLNFLILLDSIITDQKLPILEQEPWLKEIVAEKRSGFKHFNNERPIESRREAHRFANNINEVIFESEDLIFGAHDVSNVLNELGLRRLLENFTTGLKISFVSMFFGINEISYFLGSSFPPNKIVFDTWQVEFNAYEKFGYYIGGLEPFLFDDDCLEHPIKCLPDVKKYFK